MDDGQKRALIKIGGRHIRFDVSMAEYTTFQAGGKAEALFEAREEGALLQVLALLRKETIPHLVFGRGSNLLVRDGGLEGVAIRLCGNLELIRREDGMANSLVCGGGASLSKVLACCGREGLSGLEFLSGIPGTVGGAVAMNAGAFGREMEGVVREIRILGPEGELSRKTRADLRFSYRCLQMEEGSVILGVSLLLEKDDPEAVSKRMSENLRRRKETQPLGLPSAGSVFKNPAGDYAGRLMERAGLKGERVGGAMISPKHANWIVNLGGATAEDILTLVGIARKRVREETGLELELELRVVGP